MSQPTRLVMTLPGKARLGGSMPAPRNATFHFSIDDVTKSDVKRLHDALTKIGHSIAPEETSGREIGDTTADAIRDVQRRAELTETGQLDSHTVDAIAADVTRVF